MHRSLQHAGTCLHAGGQRAVWRAHCTAAQTRAIVCYRPDSRSRHRQGVASKALSLIMDAPAVMTDIKQLLELLMERKDLTEQQTKDALLALLEGADPTQIAAFLVLLRAKGETAAEIAGLADGMLELCVPVHVEGDVLDIVGTGGDGIGSVNISTGAAIVAAAAGARVAKIGNRSVSSLCGSADVLEALNVAVDLGPDSVARCISEAGLGFMFAPRFHPAFVAIRAVRKSLGIRTAFNILGPMLNPANAAYGLIGVYHPSVSPLMAAALQKRGVRKALVVHSMGLDELTPLGPADVVEVTQQGTRSYSLEPRDLGIPRCTVEDLQGGDRDLNARILRDVFGGARGAVADALCLNAGVALAACQVAATPQEGVQLAQEVQRAGKCAAVLDKWIAVSQECLHHESKNHS